VAPVEQAPEAAAPEVLHDDPGDLVVVAPVVDGHHVGVVERRRGLGLGPEAAQEDLVVGQRLVEHLHRHLALEPHVVGHEDLRRRAPPDRGQQAVPPAEDTTDLLGHAGRWHPRKSTGSAPPPP
jgi:hypothetical protein